MSLHINRVLSWSAWVPALLVGSFTGLWFHQQDLVMVILTIQTSIDAASTKTLQSDVRAADIKRMEMMQHQINLLVEMTKAAERRDQLAAKRDKTMLAALEARSDLLDFFGKEVASRGRSAKTPKRSSRNRKANGRTTRKK